MNRAKRLINLAIYLFVTASFLKVVIALVAMISASLVFISCEEMETVPVEKYHPVLENVFAGMKLVKEHPVEDFMLFTEYSTSYDTSRWRITGSKEIKIRAWPSPTEAQVMIEHVHIDCSIRATKAGIDGLIQDSMDDKLHVGVQPGFWITPDYPYETHFAIEGFSKFLREGWIYYWSGYGQGRQTEVRLTERNLRREGGAYASQISVVL